MKGGVLRSLMALWVRDPVLSLLWPEFHPWCYELLQAVGVAKKKKNKVEDLCQLGLLG